MKARIFYFILILVLAGAACQSGTATDDPEPAPPDPTDTTVPVEAPTDTPTEVPPTATATEAPPTATATEVPPTATETPVPDPILISDETADDGCTLVELNPPAWSPLYSAYNAGSDPFFHIHTNEADFFVGMELYTVYGSGWTGQTGSFEPDCNANGICVYLDPDTQGAYLASEGEIEIGALSQTDDQLDLPVSITLHDVTFDPVPGSGLTGCYHVEELLIEIME